MHRIFQSVATKNRRVNASSLISSYRCYNYQTQIYTTQFEPTGKGSEAIKAELDSNIGHRNANPNLYRFVKAYHQSGHKRGDVNPLNVSGNKPDVFELTPEFYGLDKADTTTRYSTQGLLNSDAATMTLSEIENYLSCTFSEKMTIEFEHVQCELEKEWIAKEFEQMQATQVDLGDKIEILKLLLKSQVTEKQPTNYHISKNLL